MAKVKENAAPENRERKAGKTTDSEPSRNRGLCFLCKIESTCTFPKDPERLGLYCEEFVPYESRPMKIKDDKISSSPSEGRSESEEETSKYKGLCSNCEIRETCQFPKPIWGVWHCGEYR